MAAHTKPYEKKYCIVCGAEIPKSKLISIPIYNKKIFCSNACKYKYFHEKSLAEVSCAYCGKKIKRKKSEIAKAKHFFCSKECYHKWRHKKGVVLVKCAYCGKEHYRIKSAVGKHNNFCDWVCFVKWKKGEKPTTTSNNDNENKSKQNNPSK